MTDTNSRAGAPVDTVLGHPRGLFVLFFAEMWERFSFYGMRALLVLYLTKHFLFDDAAATGIYATYGSMVYLMPIVGGMLADRYLGFRKAIAFGAVLLCLGHLGMAFEGVPAYLSGDAVVRDAAAVQVFYLSLALIIIGVGFLKPNISSIVGALYEDMDERRDSGFTIFYMGINVGAWAAAIVCGYLGEVYGWAYGFGAAGIGMLIGLITFVRGRRRLEGAGEPPDPVALAARRVGPLSTEHVIYLCAFGGVGGAMLLMQYRDVVNVMLYATAALVVAGVIWYSITRCTPVERDRMLVVLGLTGVSVVFWSLFEQAGSSMTLFADRAVDREVFGMTVRTGQLQSLNPMFIFMLAPAFAWLWVRLARAGREPSTPAKFGLAVLQVGLGFVALVIGANNPDQNGMVALGWLVLAYLLHTTGELGLSPVGLSMVTKLSVPRVVGLMMGVWFLASSVSHLVAGAIAAMAAAPQDGSIADPLAVYADAFTLVAWVGVGVGVVVLALAPLIRRYMHVDASPPAARQSVPRSETTPDSA